MIQPTVAEFKITVETSDYQPLYRERVKEIRKSMQMPGFRAGHVPANIVEKKHGQSILIETVLRLAHSWLQEYAEDFELRTLAEPLLHHVDEGQLDPSQNQDIHLTYRWTIIPPFEVNLDDLPEFPLYQIELTDEDFENDFRNLRSRFGTARPVERADLIDQLYEYHLSIYPVDALGNPLDETNEQVLEYLKAFREKEAHEGTEPQPAIEYLKLDSRYRNVQSSEMNKLLFNKAVGEHVRTDWEDLKARIGSLPFFDSNIPSDLVDIYRHAGFFIEISAIYEISLHAVDAELFNAVFPDRPYPGPDGFREMYRNSLEAELPQMAKDYVKRRLISELAKQHPIDLHSDVLFEQFQNQVVSSVKEEDRPRITVNWLVEQYHKFLSQTNVNLYYTAIIEHMGDRLDFSDEHFKEFLKGRIAPAVANMKDHEKATLAPKYFDSNFEVNVDALAEDLVEKEISNRSPAYNQFRSDELDRVLFGEALKLTQESITFGHFVRDVYTQPAN